MRLWSGWSRFFLLSILPVLCFALSNGASADEYRDVHRCDEYAAHPDDPNRWAKGVADDEIVPGPAVTFCGEAFKAHPDTPRFRFQFARALAAAGRGDEAEGMLRALEKDSAYPFASKVVLEASTPPVDAEAHAAEKPSPRPALGSDVFVADRYWQSNVLSALYEGDLDALRAINLGSTRMIGTTISHKDIYLSNLSEAFGPPYSASDRSCINLYDPAVRHRFITRLSASQIGKSNEDALRYSLGAITELMRDMERGGPQAIAGRAQALELFKERSLQDARRFRAAHSCGGEVARRVYANLRAYVLGVEGLPSAAVRERRRKAEEATALRLRRQEETERREAARNACMKDFKREPFCTCVIDRLSGSDLSEDDWKTIGGDFRKIITVAASLPNFTKTLSECRR